MYTWFHKLIFNIYNTTFIKCNNSAVKILLFIYQYCFIYIKHYVYFSFTVGSRTEVRNMPTKLMSKSIVTMIKRIACRSLNSIRGYELIDLPTLSIGHCLLTSGVPSYSGLHRVNASNYCIEFQLRSQLLQ